MLVAIGVECMSRTQALKSAQPKLERPPPTLQMSSWVLPKDLPFEAGQYLLPETPSMLQWIHDLHSAEHPVQRWSWWQLYLDAWLQLPNFGPWYHVASKKWRPGASQPPETFQRKARWFSKYVTKLYKTCRVTLPLQHATPSGSAIAFWTTTLPVCVPISRTTILDEWFGLHFPCASKTADLKRIHL